MFAWGVSYPFDSIKVYIQAHKRQEKSYKVAQEILRLHGISHLYRGWTVQLLRAFPTNAVGLFVVDSLKKRLA
jgi:outer membrane biogenesis lipoprotein LolB